MRTLGKMVALNVFTVVVAPMLLAYLTHQDASPTSRTRIDSLHRLIARNY